MPLAILLNEKILLVGGRLNSNAVNQVLEFDPATNQWTEKHQCQRQDMVKNLLLVDGKVWAIGGSTPNVVEIYDVRTILGELGLYQKAEGIQLCGWTLDGKIYVAGVQATPPDLQSKLMKFTKTNHWVDVGSLPENKYTADATVLTEKFILLRAQQWY